MLRRSACAAIAAAVVAGCAGERPRQFSASPPQMAENRPNASFYYEAGEEGRVQAQAEKFCDMYGLTPRLLFDGMAGSDLLAAYDCR